VELFFLTFNPIDDLTFLGLIITIAFVIVVSIIIIIVLLILFKFTSSTSG